LSHIPEGPKNACESVYFSLDGNGNPDVKEVVVRARSQDELTSKIGKVEKLSPNTVVLNGTIRKFDRVLEQVLETKNE
jgi:hypothetical protein